MKNIQKSSLIIFGYSEILTLGLVVNSKLDKVKEFNVIEDNDEDKFFKEISNFAEFCKFSALLMIAQRIFRFKNLEHVREIPTKFHQHLKKNL